MSIEERECENHYVNNVSRDENGRYIVELPLKSNFNDLGRSKMSAQQQFIRMEQRFLQNENMHGGYAQFMREYENLNHMELVSDENYCNSNTLQYYLPHHCVFRPSSETTKIRVVFNASFKTSSNIALNDVLKTGPTIQPDLFSILLKFRKHKYAFSADIVKMYQQINVRVQDQDLQRRWGRDSIDEPVHIYKLSTVTYGTACAPHLAVSHL